MTRPKQRVASRSLNCPACGAPIEMRGFTLTKTLACEYCGSTVDTSGEGYQLIDRSEKAKRKSPVELGKKGELRGHTWQTIGYMVRSVDVDGTRYRWDEVLLFNPYHGFRYLIIQNGHFNFIEPLPGRPTKFGMSASYEGQSYKHFSSAVARVDYVLGELPWEVRKGDQVHMTDWVAPPHMLSEEASDQETNYSRATYLERAEVEAAFGPVKVGAKTGIAPNQPNPLKPDMRWFAPAAALAFGLWLLIVIGYVFGSQNAAIADLVVNPPGQGEQNPSKVIKVTSRRDPATLEIEGTADVSNSWVYLEMMLVDQAKETAIPVGMEISYYSGSDWSEGSRDSSMVLGDVPNGEYLLQVTGRQGIYNGPVRLTVNRDVPLYRYPCCTFFLILLVPAFYIIRYGMVEQQRWSESDHAGGG